MYHAQIYSSPTEPAAQQAVPSPIGSRATGSSPSDNQDLHERRACPRKMSGNRVNVFVTLSRGAVLHLHVHPTLLLRTCWSVVGWCDGSSAMSRVFELCVTLKTIINWSHVQARRTGAFMKVDYIYMRSVFTDDNNILVFSSTSAEWRLA